MERIVFLSALFMALLMETCTAAGAYAQQYNTVRQQNNRANDVDMVHLNEGSYATNLETIMQLLAERDAQEDEWRRSEAIERENLLAELSAQKRGGSGFNYYGARGKKSEGGGQQKRFNYFPSRGK